ncbi:hypothetical protein ABT369_38605 [Dactylosporangium sp. NPDC000244]|uniref:hypothetical protein n=1 Tax=Dactylosporangium sp. NPDC000244 TaxID=3154365 RepID=UPI00331BCD21
MTRTTTVQLRNPRTILRCADCGGEARLTPGGPVCSAGQPSPAEPLRPPGHGQGLDAPPCAERAQPQFPDSGDYRVRMCVRCGRITARLDLDGVAWCGGILTEQSKPIRHLTLVGA